MFVGLDIGGTKFQVASAEKNGNILKRVREVTPVELESGLDLLHEMIEEVSDGQSIGGIGAAIGGPLDWRTGVVSPLHQPEWRDVPLKQIMEDRWGCPFFVDVDTNVAALAEYRLAANEANRLLYITLSTGMGGGFIIDGRIYRGGLNESHPEIGHQAIPFKVRHPERVICECGINNCLEGLISGNAIRRIYGKAAENLDETEWEEVACNLGQGLRNIATILSPDVIAIGGGVAVGGGEAFIKRAAEVMSENLRIVPAPSVRLSKLGYDTALLGAIVMAQQSKPISAHVSGGTYTT